MGGYKIHELKQELQGAIDQMSLRTRFGIVAFSDSSIIYNRVPRFANKPQKRRAKQWIARLIPAGATHMREAADRLIEIALKAPRKNRSIIAIGDGYPFPEDPEETLTHIVRTTPHGTPWNTIFVGTGNEGASFMRKLAHLTGGTFRWAQESN